MTIEERWKHIEILSDLRTKYSCFDDSEEPYYKALSVAIKALKQEPCEDAINREDAINKIEEWADGFEDGEYFSGKSVADAIRACGGIVAELPSVTPSYNSVKTELEQTRWIPVSERLPKAGEYVGDVDKYYLVQNEYGDMLVARYTHSEYWEQIFRFHPISDEIVAWMPLPEPYKAESEVTDADSN